MSVRARAGSIWLTVVFTGNPCVPLMCGFYSWSGFCINIALGSKRHMLCIGYRWRCKACVGRACGLVAAQAQEPAPIWCLCSQCISLSVSFTGLQTDFTGQAIFSGRSGEFQQGVTCVPLIFPNWVVWWFFHIRVVGILHLLLAFPAVGDPNHHLLEWPAIMGYWAPRALSGGSAQVTSVQML